MGPDSAPSTTHIPLEDAEQAAASFGSLRPGNPVLRSALRLLRGEPIESIQPLHIALKDPNPKRWRERMAAAWVLGRTPLGPEDSDAAAGTLMNVLEHEFSERGRRKLVRWTVRTYSAALVLAIFLIVTGLLFDRPPWSGEPFPLMLLFLFLLLGTVALPFSMVVQSLWEESRNDKVRAEAARALGHRGHVETVGSLAGCLFDCSFAVRQASAEALHRLLPAITGADYGILGADSVTKLGRVLTDSDGTLVAKALDALEKAGTSHAIPHVERLLRNTGSTLTRDRAQRVLDVLNARKRREIEGEGLLRAITSPQDPAALLRPAQSAAESEIEQLLRPAGENLN